MVMDGDENTTFFHGYVNNKHRKNRIMGLQIGGLWVTEAEMMKTESFDFYQKKFLEKWSSRPKLVSNKFSKLDSNAKSQLEIPFTVDKIKCVVWDCGSEKAPGPDGFTFKFLKKYWEMMKDDILQFAKYFKRHGKLGRGCNSSFITLVPKIKDPVTIGDFRPISLIGCMYKIITKTLSNRLKKVIDMSIGDV